MTGVPEIDVQIRSGLLTVNEIRVEHDVTGQLRRTLVGEEREPVEVGYLDADSSPRPYRRGQRVVYSLPPDPVLKAPTSLREADAEMLKEKWMRKVQDSDGRLMVLPGSSYSQQLAEYYGRRVLTAPPHDVENCEVRECAGCDRWAIEQAYAEMDLSGTALRGALTAYTLSKIS